MDIDYIMEESFKTRVFSPKRLILPEDFKISQAKDSIITDDKGNNYIDFTSNLDHNSLGYNNSQVQELISNNINTPLFMPENFKSEILTTFSKSISEITHLDKVFVSTSASEANNVSLKLLSLWLKYEFPQKDSFEFISLKGSGSQNFVDKFKIKHNNLNNVEDFQISFELLSRNYFQSSVLKTIFSKNVAAILIDPFKVVEGTLMIDHEIAPVASKLCERNNALLLFDMTNMSAGRTGELLPITNIKPDIITLSKGFNQGYPIGITAISFNLSQLASKYYFHNYFYSSLTLQIANAYLEALENTTTIEDIRSKSDYLFNKLNDLKDKYLNIIEITHKGLFTCIEMDFDLTELVSRCFKDGIILELYDTNNLILKPPFCITLEQIDKLFEILDKHLNDLKSDYRMQ